MLRPGHQGHTSAGTHHSSWPIHRIHAGVARQLVRQRLDRDNPVTCAFLALEEAPGLQAQAHGEAGRLDKCPRQILVAVLCVDLAFLPSVAFAPTVDTAAVRREITNLGETRDGSGSQHDRGCENGTNAGHRGFQSAPSRFASPPDWPAS